MNITNHKPNYKLHTKKSHKIDLSNSHALTLLRNLLERSHTELSHLAPGPRLTAPRYTFTTRSRTYLYTKDLFLFELVEQILLIQGNNIRKIF